MNIYIGKKYKYEEMDAIVTIGADNYADSDFMVVNSNGNVSCFVESLGIQLTVNMKDLTEIKKDLTNEKKNDTMNKKGVDYMTINGIIKVVRRERTKNGLTDDKSIKGMIIRHIKTKYDTDIVCYKYKAVINGKVVFHTDAKVPIDIANRVIKHYSHSIKQRALIKKMENGGL